MKQIITLLCFIISFSGAKAHSFTSEVVYLGNHILTCNVLDEDAMTCEIIGVKFSFINSSKYSVEIPSVVSDGYDSYTVVSINAGVSYNGGAGALKSLSIPNTVKSVTRLQFRVPTTDNFKIILPDDLKDLGGIDIMDSNWNYEKAIITTTSHKDDPGSYINARHIAYNAIKCKNVGDTLTIGERVESIGTNFLNCECSKVKFLNSLKKIPDYAFEGCGLNQIVWPQDLEEIGVSAFKNCSFTKLDLPQGLMTIQDGAFYGNKITHLSLPYSVVYVGSEAFGGMLSFEEPLQEKYACSVLEKNITRALYSLTVLGEYTRFHQDAFKSSSVYTDIGVPKVAARNIETFEERFPCNCLWLWSIEENETIDEDGVIWATDPSKEISVFFPADYCKEAILPEGMTTLTPITFAGCAHLKRASLPNSLEKIEMSSFEGCISLKTLLIPPGVTEVDDYWGGNRMCDDDQNWAFGFDPSVLVLPEGLQSKDVVYEDEDNDSKLWAELIPYNPLEVKYNRDYLTNLDGDKILYISPALETFSMPSDVTGFDLRYFEHLSISEFNNTRLMELKLSPDLQNLNMAIRNLCRCGKPNYTNFRLLYPTDNPVRLSVDEFSDEDYKCVHLVIPKGTRTAFTSVNPWKRFKNIIEDETLSAGIDDVIYGKSIGIIDYTQAYEVYNFSGICVGGNVEGLAPGIYIVRQGGKSAKLAIR